MTIQKTYFDLVKDIEVATEPEYWETMKGDIQTDKVIRFRHPSVDWLYVDHIYDDVLDMLTIHVDVDPMKKDLTETQSVEITKRVNKAIASLPFSRKFGDAEAVYIPKQVQSTCLMCETVGALQTEEVAKKILAAVVDEISR